LFAPYRPTRYFAADSKNVIAKIKSLFFFICYIYKKIFRYRDPVFFGDLIFALLLGSFAVFCATYHVDGRQAF